ncbi:hypothetical protein [Nitrosomonas ureae]|uniref:hypothetical protein n=1 Tax=Nitrosomonas ureae TaxID=44577 RepID=UPI0015E1CCAA|nr:hypothetical protein [Nitrosomonas ureae]
MNTHSKHRIVIVGGGVVVTENMSTHQASFWLTVIPPMYGSLCSTRSPQVRAMFPSSKPPILAWQKTRDFHSNLENLPD